MYSRRLIDVLTGRATRIQEGVVPTVAEVPETAAESWDRRQKRKGYWPNDSWCWEPFPDVLKWGQYSLNAADNDVWIYCIHTNICDWSLNKKLTFFAFIIHSIYFSESLQLIAEVAKSQFLLIVFISQQVFSHLFVSHLFSRIQYHRQKKLLLLLESTVWGRERRSLCSESQR